MIPRWHFIIGLAATLVIMILFPSISLTELLFFFFANFLIDIDHYLTALNSTKSISIKKAIAYNNHINKLAEEERKKGIQKKGDFHIFHTIEFHFFILLIGLIHSPILFIFFGMLFHSITDVIWLNKEGYLYRREFLLFNWLRSRN